MLGIIVQLAVSWLIIWLCEKKHLGVLGFFPTKHRLLYFAIFLLVTAIFCTSGYILRMYFGKEEWILNPNISSLLILSGVWWNIKSVLFEELIFRGVLLYILIKKAGPAIAIAISSIAFGIYHWFSMEIFGNVIQMIVIFFVTGAMGLLLAYAFYKTSTILIPIAIHLGWNATTQIIFSEGPIGDQLLTKVEPVPEVTVSWLVYIIVIYFPVISMFAINYFLLRFKSRIITNHEKII